MGDSLHRMLNPRSMAVLGVSSKAESLSGKLLENIFNAGFTGAVYPVNPKARAIRGYPCVPSVKEIGVPVDLAVVMVPRDAVLLGVDECLEVGVGGLVVITAGFREGGEAGLAAERAVVERVRRSGVRMIGPNCMGLLNTDPRVRLDATFSPAAALPGSVAFASHSGALGVAVLEMARVAGLGFSHFVSLGNSADVTVTDLLEAWEHHDATEVILLYLEALDDPRRFLEIASRVSRTKPIIAFKGGRTAAAQRAASSHTGAMAGGDTGAAALLAQAGVVRADTLEEMFDLALAFQRVPRPAGGRVAVVTNAGGPGIAAVDAIELGGLTMAELSPATTDTLRSFLAPEASVGNPVDMLPAATPENYRQAVELAVADEAVDAVMAIAVTPPLTGPFRVLEALTAAAAGSPKPVVTVFMTDPVFHQQVSGLPGHPPVFRYPEAAARTLAGLAGRAAQPHRAPAPLPGGPLSGSLSAVAAGGFDGYLDQAKAFGVLEEIGIPVAPFRMAPAAGVVVAAAAVGYPVVLKAVGEALVHKSELGAVAVGLTDEAALTSALTAMEARLAAAGVRAEGYMVQRFLSGGIEVILGVVRDPAVGPLVMCGLGGVAVEVWKDVSFRVAPVDVEEAAAMVAELRGAPLLGAFRGRHAADTEAFAHALARLSALAAAHPALAECDINPLLLFPSGQGCAAVDVRIRLQP